MIIKSMRAMVLILIASIAIACGTVATPVFEAPDEEAILEANVAGDNTDDEVVVAPTETPIPPTATLEPPTATPEPPPATPTDEATEEVAAPADPITRLVASRDADKGELLFNEFFPATGFACATCHHVAQEGTLIGPSMLGIPTIASTRVDGVAVERYLYESIINPNDYVVEGFTAGVMPQTWNEILNDTDIYDIIAYLMTLDA